MRLLNLNDDEWIAQQQQSKKPPNSSKTDPSAQQQSKEYSSSENANKQNPAFFLFNNIFSHYVTLVALA
jgi:hypothetical protein